MFASAVEAVRSFASQALRRDPLVEPAPNTLVPSFACPICDSAMTIRESMELESWHASAVRLHALRCDTCGMLADRLYHPCGGYDAGVPA